MGASIGAKIKSAPGVEPVGFSISGGSGPNAPLVLIEDKPQAHFLIVETYQPVATARWNRPVWSHVASDVDPE
jgi:hypothetical protein